MKKSVEAKLLRIFIGDSDKLGHKPLYEEIVFSAKKHGLSGASVLRGVMGFGANSRIHTAKLFEISTDLPIIIEIIDYEDKIDSFVEIVENMIEQTNSGALITLERADVIRYKAGKRSDPSVEP